MRNFSTKSDNTAPAASGVLTAAEDNVRFNEMKNAVTSAGITLDGATGPDTNLNMLAEAMARYASGAVMCVDNGAANTYVLSITGGFIAPKSYFKGMRVRFYAGFSNSGASTISAFGLGSRKLLTHATGAMSGGEVLATREIEADFDPSLDGGNGAFRICPWANALLFPVAAPTSTQVTTGEGISVQTASPYHVDMNYPALTTTTTIANADLIALYKATVSGGATHHQAITWENLLGLITTTLPTVSPVTPPATYAHSLTFTSTGADQSWTVPSGTTWVKLRVWGGYADWFGTGNCGNGYVQAEFPVGAGLQVAVGDVLRLMVGSPGVVSNGGGVHAGGYGFGGDGVSVNNTSGQVSGGGSGLSAVLKPGGSIAVGDVAAGTALLVAGGCGGFQYLYSVYTVGAIGANQSGSGDQTTAQGANAVSAFPISGTGGLGGGGGGFRGGHAGVQTTPITKASSGSNYVAPSAVNPMNLPGLTFTGTPTSTAASLTNSDFSKIIIDWN